MAGTRRPRLGLVDSVGAPTAEELRQLRSDWDDMAQINPLWSLAPSDRVANRSWDVEEFFQTGKNHVARDLRWIHEAGITLGRARMLDFGCGVGRETQAFASEFQSCWGVDISARMIELANGFNKFGDRCRYVVNCSEHLGVFDDDLFDLVYSNNALCHVTPPLIKGYLAEFVRVLRQPGVLMFQIPLARLTADASGAHLRSLPKYHPQRILNKLKGVTIGHDQTSRYAKLRRIGLRGTWINRLFGFQPRVTMNFLDEAEVSNLLGQLNLTIARVEKYAYRDRLDAVFIAVKGAEGSFGRVRPDPPPR